MRNADAPAVKTVHFISGSRADMLALPKEVRAEFGHSTWQIENGETPSNASPFEGGKAHEVMKLTERYDGDTYRCVYAAKFEQAVYILHVFQKKSKSGIATPQKDINTVQERLQRAKKDYEERYGK